LPFTVAPVEVAPVLVRVWPDPSPALLSAGAVWCAPFALPEVDREVTLAPAGSAGRLVRGTGTNVPAASCLSWFARADAPAPQAMPAVTPTWIELDEGKAALLEPVQLWPGVPEPVPDPLTCDGTEVRFGPGCITVEDDRMVLRPPEQRILWTIAASESGTTVRKSRAGHSFVVRPLPADGRYRWAALDESGRNLEGAVTLTPSPAMTHLVITEVMANPAGIEKDQEWVELYNDGERPIAVGGYALEAGGRSTLLPAGVIGPGAFALIVTEGFVDDDGVDPSPAPGTLLLRVSAIGGDGLSNDGERLALRDGAGQTLSAFPAMKAKSGVSNARVAPDALDEYLDSFAPSSNGSATPGAPYAAP
jgi:hypothetical protein